MNSLQKIEDLCKEISIQSKLYREASDRDEMSEVKKKILSRMINLERELNEIRQQPNVQISPD